MAGGTNIQVFGMERTLSEIDKKKAAVSNLIPAFRVFDRRIGTFFRKQFERKGRPGGNQWTPLAETTKKWRTRDPGGNRGGLGRPLWHTGELKASLQEAGPESIRVFMPHTYERGSRLERAEIHQKGLGVPKREIVPDPLPNRLVIEWERTLKKHVDEGGLF